LGANAEAVGERQIHISTLYAGLRAADLGLGCRPACRNLKCASESGARLVENALDMWERGEISADAVIEAFRDIMTFLTAGPASETRRKRAVVGGLLHLLVGWPARGPLCGEEAERGQQSRNTPASPSRRSVYEVLHPRSWHSDGRVNSPRPA